MNEHNFGQTLLFAQACLRTDIEAEYSEDIEILRKEKSAKPSSGHLGLKQHRITRPKSILIGILYRHAPIFFQDITIKNELICNKAFIAGELKYRHDDERLKYNYILAELT